MSNPFVGEIRLFAGNFAPQGWAFCDGAIIAIAENDTLFNLIGTTYGGDGQSTFALPDLRGRVPTHLGQGPGTPNMILAEKAGAETVTLLAANLPLHNHTVNAVTGGVRETVPANNMLAAGGPEMYTSGSIAAPGALFGGLQQAGSSQPHQNMAPYLTVSFIISLFGIFPSP